jgi:hypothetical protein
MSSDVSGLSSSGFTLLAIAVAATRASLTAAASREGLGGGVVGEIITAHIIRGIDFLLGFGTLALRRRYIYLPQKALAWKLKPPACSHSRFFPTN